MFLRFVNYVFVCCLNLSLFQSCINVLRPLTVFTDTVKKRIDQKFKNGKGCNLKMLLDCLFIMSLTRFIGAFSPQKNKQSDKDDKDEGHADGDDETAAAAHQLFSVIRPPKDRPHPRGGCVGGRGSGVLQKDDGLGVSGSWGITAILPLAPLQAKKYIKDDL